MNWPLRTSLPHRTESKKFRVIEEQDLSQGNFLEVQTEFGNSNGREDTMPLEVVTFSDFTHSKLTHSPRKKADFLKSFVLVNHF